MDGRRWKGSIKAIQKKSKGILRKSVRADLFEPVAFGKQWAVASVTNGAAVTPVYPPNYWLLENSLMVHFKRRTSRRALASVTNRAAVTPIHPPMHLLLENIGVDNFEHRASRPQLASVSCWLLAAGRWLPAIGRWPLAAGCRRQGIG